MPIAFHVCSSTTPVWDRPARHWKFFTAVTNEASTLASFMVCQIPSRRWTIMTLMPFMPQVRVFVLAPRPVMRSVGCR